MKRVVLYAGALVVACGARTGLGVGDGRDTDAGRDSAANDGGEAVESGARDGTSPAMDAMSPGPPSCAPEGPGTSGCGTPLESCCGALPVSAGTFFRTYANDGGGPTGEADPATVSGLLLDTYVVTVGRFRQFAAAWSSGYRPSPGSGKHTHLHGGLGLANSAAPGTYEAGWDPADEASVAPTDANLGSCGAFSTWTSTVAAREALPIDCMTWPEAYAFCIWDGGFLPSESEWEFAAAGGSQQREYPWGSADPGTHNEYAIYGCYFDPPDAQTVCNFQNLPGIAPVGTATLGLGLWGQLDLAGNVWEETLDAFAAYVDPCADCAYLVAGAAKAIRGGSFINSEEEIVPPNRFELPAAIRNNYTGFRCARAP